MISEDVPVAVAIFMFVGFTESDSSVAMSLCNRLFDAPVSMRHLISLVDGGRVIATKNNFCPTFVL